ncbi:homeobox domain-containing protein [Arthroderma uncinatum]|uniref:homeobox domain-containing protein n=1 Tax=Arthroderma uncinatum TaxID=74035 RepID=UPI00144ADB56|nr:homeobox domain-containing protein [Arthroderma uncinatum]KAF3483645.1 homeobox domain-containing protein [Arthroderma uncinatum]
MSTTSTPNSASMMSDAPFAPSGGISTPTDTMSMATPPPTATSQVSSSSSSTTTTTAAAMTGMNATASDSPSTRPASRRPPRKSTLTQQQKNHKRQRATQDQLVTLEMEFKKNPTPTAAVREQIAENINMTERSVQIWFQNRRAKIKMIAKRGIETGEDCDAVPESMRRYLALQLDPAGSNARNMLGRAGGYPSNEPMMHSATSSKVVIQHFACRSLRIGTWRRVGQNTMDLVIFYSPDQACMTYYINNDSAGYKIEYPFSHIKNIILEPGDPVPPLDGALPRSGGLVIELNRPPNFYMDSSNSGGFYQCGDFTEEQQATKSLIHHLGGHPKVLSVQLAKLVSLETFQNRHAQSYPFTPNTPFIDGSPQFVQIHRPASQPNHLSRAQNRLSVDNHLSVGLHPNRGHKRQRSRSVPGPVDFAALHAMPAFHFQPTSHFQPSATHHHEHQQQDIYAPVPLAHSQFHLPLNMTESDLHVDTSATQPPPSFSMYPASATTSAATPATEFASTPLFSSASDQPQSMGTPYSLPFLSPSPAVDIDIDIDPLTIPQQHHNQSNTHAHSPPLTSTQRSSPANMFGSSTVTTAGVDDGILLSDLYAKQNLGCSGSISSPGMEMDESFSMTFQGMRGHGHGHGMIGMGFDSGTVDPSSLAAES